MKAVAMRNKYKSEEEFFKYLRACGWKEEEIKEMYDYKERNKDNV